MAQLCLCGEVFGRRAALNVAIFNQWIQDVQRVEFPPDPTGVSASIAVTANVPSEQVRGIEIDGSFMPFDWLEIGGAGAITDARYDDGSLELFGTSFLYGPPADTPKASGVLWGVVTFPTDDSIGDISLRGEVYSQSSMFFSSASSANAPDTELPGYTLVSGRLQWDNVMGSNVSAALFGKNLTDEEYFVGGMTLAAALGHNGAAVGEPRTFGLELSYRY
jgi:iron complex outermembrane receptor protein